MNPYKKGKKKILKIAKGAIRSHTSKNGRQYNGYKKKRQAIQWLSEKDQNDKHYTMIHIGQSLHKGVI